MSSIKKTVLTKKYIQKQHHKKNIKNNDSKKKINKDEFEDIPKLQKHDVIFDLSHLKTLIESENFYTSVPAYINKFFIRYGDKIFFDKGDHYNLLTKTSAENEIPSNFDLTCVENKNGKIKEKKINLSEYFSHQLFLETPEAKTIIDYNKDYKYIDTCNVKGFEIPYTFLNMKKDLPRNYDKPIKITPFVQTGIDKFFYHIKDVICSGYENEYNTVVKFLAASCAGHKVKFAIVMQSIEEQAGKGTIINFMKDILGQRMYKTSSCEDIIKYTKNLEGCSLINFDEVPINGSIKTFQDTLKSLITENEFNCRGMHSQGYSQTNTFNCILSSNNNCVLLSQSNKERYFICTCSNKYAGDKGREYFDDLHKYLNNNDVKIAIFQKFMQIYETEIKPTNWLKPEDKNTEAGKIKIIDALPKAIKFIKNDFLMKCYDLDETCDDLFNLYKSKYCSDATSKSTFGQTLSTLSIIAKRINNKEFNGRKYIMDYQTLKQNFISKKWLLDEELEDLEIIEQEKGVTIKPIDQKASLDNDVKLDDEVKIDYEALYKQQLVKLKELETQIKEIKEMKKQVTLPYFDFEKVDKLIDEVNTLKPIKPVKGFNNMIQK